MFSDPDAAAAREKTLQRSPGIVAPRMLACVALALSVLAVFHYRREVSWRLESESFFRHFSLDKTRPLDLQAMRLEPAGDLASDVAVDGALRELMTIPRSNSGISDGMLVAARNLILDSIERRPGSVHHLLLLGEVAHAEQSGKIASPDGSPLQVVLWAHPFRVASAAAPGMDAAWEAFASSGVTSWSHLGPREQAEVTVALRRAFFDPHFVQREFPLAVATLGGPAAVRLLPQIAQPLRVAVQTSLKGGDVATAGLLFRSADRAERRQRSEDLRKIEVRGRLRDLEGMRRDCTSWVTEHSVLDFGDPQGLAQVDRVLDLWPDDRVSEWSMDPRSDLVSFCLDRTRGEVNSQAIVRAVDSLLGVPASVRARARLMAGDFRGAEEIAENDHAGSSIEWTPFFVSLARLQRLQGDSLSARSALDRVIPAAREDCDVLLERRAIGRALSNREEIDRSQQALFKRRVADLQSSWTAAGMLTLCVDPEALGGMIVDVDLESTGPSFVSFGWEGGRLGSLVVDPTASVSFPLAGLSGRRTLWLRTRAGATTRPTATRLRPAPASHGTPPAAPPPS